jgi:DNA-binding NarL/FixJ family response regulator
MISVIVVDDHAVVRRGLVEILAESEGIEIVGEAGSSQELRLLLDRVVPDVLVLDIGLPDSRGTNTIDDVRRSHPGVKILVLTIQPESVYAVRSIQAGARGYLTKRTAPSDLLQAVTVIAGGGRYLTDPVASQLADTVASAPDLAPHMRLSGREYEVFLLLAGGTTVGEVAAELFLSPKTVTTYRTRILRKLGYTRNSQLTAYALEHQLL